MSRWIIALLVQAAAFKAVLGDATEEGVCSTPIPADTTPPQALLQKGTRISESATNFVGVQMSAHQAPKLLNEDEDEGPKLEGHEADLVGPGNYEPLSEAGYQTVAATCCSYNMEEYIRRLVIDLGLELCGDAGLNGLVPYYTCEKGIQTFANLRAELVNKVAEPCAVAALPGTCPSDASKCGGAFDATVHRRRNCKSGIVNTFTTTTLTTTAAITTTKATTTLSILTTTTTTTTTTTSTTTTATTRTTTTRTTVTTLTTTTTSTGCTGETDLLDFFNANLAHNNLGGKGPNAGDSNIRYEGIGVANGKPYDLVVTGSGYKSSHTSDNGYECGMTSASCTTGRYGQIDVTAGTSVELTLSFQDSHTQAPVTLESFLFSLHDIDQLDSTVKEVVFISGFTGAAFVSNSTAVNVSKQADGRTRLASTTDECNGDNPLNPMFLGPVKCGGQTIDTKTRAAAFKFEKKASFTMTLEATCSGCAAGSHRTFMFTGDTNLVTCAARPPVY